MDELKCGVSQKKAPRVNCKCSYCIAVNRITELEAELEIKHEDAVVEVRLNFESDAITAWKKANSHLQDRNKELEEELAEVNLLIKHNQI
jgi:hypothetical protein